MKYKIAILKNENNKDHIDWINAIKNYSNILDYDIIDFTLSNWLEKVQLKKYDIFLTRPPGATSYFKQLYDERIYILNKVLDKLIYPTLDEILVYENKRFLSYWLEAKKLKHPDTFVFYNKDEALKFINSTKYPFVAKTSIGASGSGVKILRNNNEAIAYVNKAFSNIGIKRRWGPNRVKKDYSQRFKKRLSDIKGTIKYFKMKRHTVLSDTQKWFVIFQEYVDIKSEWRCVCIGDNFFGHKKERKGELISGGGGIEWDYPDDNLLNFLKEIMDEGNFLATSMDIFETNNSEFLIGEIQSFFGFINPKYQMLVNDKPGKFIYNNGKWEFVEGIFNMNNSYDLRISHVLEILKSKYNNV